MYSYRLIRAASKALASRKRPAFNRHALFQPFQCLTASIQSEEQEPLLSSARFFSSTSTNTSNEAPSRQSLQEQQRRSKSSLAVETDSLEEPDPMPTKTNNNTTKRSLATCQKQQQAQHRLERIRNVGILAHVDAGKTTVTERMLALAGVVRQVGRVDTGNTVTDYLPQERERGITIQSAAIQFDWGWHNAHYAQDHSSAMDLSVDTNDRVHIHLIDTPGHIDFSVEVHRSVAVLDGAVLVVDAVAGVQAQTETVWRTMRDTGGLPALVTINKMDKEGCHFANAIQTLRDKLPGANPLPVQLPLFRLDQPAQDNNNCLDMPEIVAMPNSQEQQGSHPEHAGSGEFVGVLDLIHMRAVVYPETNQNSSKSVEECVPDVYPLLLSGGASTPNNFYSLEDALLDPECPLTRAAVEARQALVEQLAGDCCDSLMEEYYLEDAMPSPRDLQQSIRTATLSQQALPVVAAAALRGKGLEPLLDLVADLLPSPLDRPAPALLQDEETCNLPATQQQVSLGHPLHEDLLAFAFKVCHLSGGRGGSGDGRVVFCRVYSGTLTERDVLQVVSPPEKGSDILEEARKERVGGMLELKGGLFTNKENGVCRAGDVCALVGLKTVVTGDTLVLAKKRQTKKQQKKNKKNTGNDMVCLAGVESPKPVLQVRLEAETQSEQNRLSECLQLLAVEDPSLQIEESDSGTLLSGLGELHVEVTLDRLAREFGLNVQKGAPRVAYRETILDATETDGLLHFDRTVGDTRLQGAVHLRLEPTTGSSSEDDDVRLPLEPTITVGPNVVNFLQLNPDLTHEDWLNKSQVYKALVQGCLGALKRGPVGSYAMANVHCHVEAIDAEEGLAGLQALPGAIRAAAMNAVATTMNKSSCNGRVLEPTMSVEINAPNDMVGSVLSDLTSRRGTVGDVAGDEGGTVLHQKTLVRGQVPLVEILGYANALRSLTAGEGVFTAEYKGHSVCNEVPKN